VTEAEHALEASTHDVELYAVNIADNMLVAAKDGRIQYRIANVGEVLPAGGKVFAMLASPTCTWTSISRRERRAG
jgi:HlyD family secretion protein